MNIALTAYPLWHFKPQEKKIPDEKTMRTLFLLTICLLLMFLGCRKQTSSSQTITSTTDKDGKMHPVQMQLPKPAKVTCLSAIGNDGAPAKCNVNGAPIKPPSESVTATGKLYLFCEGAAPSKCTAEVQ
ncbi:MAG: hypothetical protein WBR26_05885 [Candidatus Acidiferrum sp.]